ncbi:MAG: hypothetical protein K6U03_00480 [Firmicutes bacterium]|nr:hypothetical protein [Bacillota bacterium]
MPAGETSFLVRDNSGSYRTFIDDLREFIASRLDRVNPYRESKEYCQQQEKASQLYERLREMLPEEGQALLLQYSDALGCAHYLETALLAERAFLEGVRLILRAMEKGDGDGG